MRLLGVTMVRNEADVIEAFVRHNLSIVDGLLIVDHGSFDGTPGILAKLESEGLPLRVVHDADPAYRQAGSMTALAREALTRDAADFVFALDADEFLKVRSRTELEAALAEVPRGMHAVMHWLTYVPDAFDDDAAGFGPGHLWWRLETERQTLLKVIVSRALLERPTDSIAMGNHSVLSRTEPHAPPHARLRQDVVALAHCPVRSRAQLEAKIVIGHLAHLAARGTDRRLGRHWRELYEELDAGGTFDEKRLREIASNYGLPRKNWRPVTEIELVEDPVPLTAEPRYRVDAACDPLQLLLKFTERLVAAERERQGEAGATRYVTL
ncbi:MAG: glycosyltransferase family 2 protein [Betaproteobacteria bacterium]|nr:MAG: glycosyltransferase family 2 protein [Betaproteobacteria bacterium]